MPSDSLEITDYTMWTPRRVGYVDESYKLDAEGELVYVLGLVSVAGRPADARVALRGLLLKGQDSLRFSKENPDRRVELAAALPAAGLRATAIVCRREPGAERARGLCVRDLAWAAHGRLTDLVFETRELHENAHDASVLKGLSPLGVRLAYSFLRKEEEPLLWAADIVAGAIRASIIDPGSKAAEALRAVDLREVQ